jgi:putative flavoprotein involved in K+ transport
MRERGESVDVIVIGAGPAGLAAAHELMRVGRRVLVLEQSSAVGSSWRKHRAGQRLHTIRRLSGLPGMPIPRKYGRYVASSDLVRYLEQYADGIDVRLETTVTAVQRLGKTPERTRWVVTTGAGTVYVVAAVVVATGHNRLPYIPELPGLEGFTGSALHVSDFAGGGQFAGLDVLVVGSGNAAAEAATELVATGAGRVRLASALARLKVPDTSSSSLQRPHPDLYARVRRDGSAPVHDTGIFRLLEEGAVTPVAAVVGFDANVVILADGSEVHPDVVMFATGYRRGLEGLFDGLGVLDEQGAPRVASGVQAAPGFFFVGFTVSAIGALRQIAEDARRVANGGRMQANSGEWRRSLTFGR